VQLKKEKVNLEANSTSKEFGNLRSGCRNEVEEKLGIS